MYFEYLLPAIVQPHEHISHSGLCNSRSASQVLVATSHLQTCYHHTSYRFSCDTCPSIGDGGSRSVYVPCYSFPKDLCKACVGHRPVSDLAYRCNFAADAVSCYMVPTLEQQPS